MNVIMTLGPSSFDEETISKMLDIADKFRLNTSHLTEKDYEIWIKKINNIFSSRGKAIPVVSDLQGAKMRIGQILDYECIPEKLTLFYGNSSKEINRIPVPHKIFFESLKVDDILSLNDCKIEIKVIEISGYEAKAKVIMNGPVSSNKGINRKDHPILYKEISKKDKNLINISKNYDFIEFAFSFLFDGKESNIVKHLIGRKKLIAKIERPEAINNLSFIDKRFDEIWFCRGDLGAQAGIFNLGKLQKEFVEKIPALKNNCYLAGQVLEHMTEHKNPTRSEIVHIYDSYQNGFEGIVLSDETAIGKNVFEVIDFLKIIKNSCF